MISYDITLQTIVALDSLGKFLEETEPVVEHLSYNDHTMQSFMKLMKVFNKVLCDDENVVNGSIWFIVNN